MSFAGSVPPSQTASLRFYNPFCWLSKQLRLAKYHRHKPLAKRSFYGTHGLAGDDLRPLSALDRDFKHVAWNHSFSVSQSFFPHRMLYPCERSLKAHPLSPFSGHIPLHPIRFAEGRSVV